MYVNELALKKAEFYLRISENHLKRVDVLQGTEWRIALVYWVGIATFTGTLVSLMPNIYPLVARGFILMAGAYWMVWYSYLFRFCASNYKSLVTERNRYQYFQNRAMEIISEEGPDYIWTGKPEEGPDRKKPGSDVIRDKKFLGSSIWTFKLINTTFMLSISFLIVTIYALYLLATSQSPAVSYNLLLWIVMQGEFVIILWGCECAYVASRIARGE
jgi:hypothetical protein